MHRQTSRLMLRQMVKLQIVDPRVGGGESVQGVGVDRWALGGTIAVEAAPVHESPRSRDEERGQQRDQFLGAPAGDENHPGAACRP